MAALDKVVDPRQREPLEILVAAEDSLAWGEPYPLYTVGGGVPWTREVTLYDPARADCPRCGRSLPDPGALCLVCSATARVPIQRPMQPRKRIKRIAKSREDLRGGVGR